MAATVELLGLQKQLSMQVDATALSKRLAAKDVAQNVLGGVEAAALLEVAAGDGTQPVLLFRSNAIVRFLIALTRGPAVLAPAEVCPTK